MEETPRFPYDRIAGGIMMLGFIGIYALYLYSDYRLRSIVGESAARMPYNLTPLGYLSAALGLAILIFYSVGVCRGQRWAFAISTLAAAQEIVRGMPYWSQFTGLNLEIQGPVVFKILVFAYCGLRLVGPLGPRFPKLLPARDEARFVD